jgi:hypothetical protein
MPTNTYKASTASDLAACVSPSDWIGDWHQLTYREALAAARSNDAGMVVRAIRSAAFSDWARREVIVRTALANPAAPLEVVAFARTYWDTSDLTPAQAVAAVQLRNAGAPGHIVELARVAVELGMVAA